MKIVNNNLFLHNLLRTDPHLAGAVSKKPPPEDLADVRIWVYAPKTTANDRRISRINDVRRIGA